MNLDELVTSATLIVLILTAAEKLKKLFNNNENGKE